MQIETYFNFIDKDLIRIAGTRINIETVLRDYLQGASPEEIIIQYPTLSLEKIHAAILYYLSNHEQMEKYMELVNQRDKEQQYQKEYPENFVRELRKRIEQQRLILHKNKSDATATEQYQYNNMIKK
jgi:uncharacterized protein (DUF433 family)